MNNLLFRCNECHPERSEGSRFFGLRPQNDGHRRLSKKTVRFLAIMALFVSFAISPPLFAGDSLESVLGRMPVQQGGRTKPFASFAKETLVFVTGKTSWEKTDPTTIVWQWIADPQKWGNEPLIRVRHPELKKHFSSDLVNNRVAPNLVLNDLEFKKFVSAAQAKQDLEKKVNQVEQKQLELFHQARLFQEISTGRMPGFAPDPDDPKVAWFPLEIFQTGEGINIAKTLYPEAEVKKVSTALGVFIDRLKNNKDESVLMTQNFRRSIENLLLSRDLFFDQSSVDREYFYLKLKPFKLASILYFLCIFIWLAPKKTKKVEWAAFSIYISGFLIHTFGFVLRILISGRPPVTNMYESIIWVAWGSAFFSIVFWLFYRNSLLPTIAASVAMLGLLIGESFPTFLDPSISPLVPVLRSNFWLTIHVLTITLGYGAFLLNWGIAHTLLYMVAFKKKKQLVDHLTEYLYRSLQVGVILLASGTILGGVWAAESWGRFWGWDPKETWALIAVLAYLAVMHSRTAGWLDSFGVAFWSAISFLTVLMAWYGVNFVLGAGLHSYGFGGGGLPYVIAFIFMDLGIILWLAQRHNIKSVKAGT